jgi:CelD/BcsL family acetyltransferase involved in cellulose biosynthesis
MTEIRTELEIEKIEEVAALERLKGVWNALLEHNETKTTELTYEWQLTYWKYFAKNSKLFVLVVQQAGSVVAIAPLKLTESRKFGVKTRYLEFMAGMESNYQDFLIGNNNDEVLECILNYFITHKNMWDVLRLRHIPESSTTAHFFLNKPDDSLMSRIVGVEKCIFLKLDKTWEAYTAASKKARNKIAYKTRKLQKLGEINCFHCLQEEQLRANLLKFFELHRKQWNITDTPSQFNDDRYCQFYLDVSLQLLPKRQIDLFVLEVEETPVALLYAFLFAGSCTQQLTAYDIEYAKMSPSLIMHEKFMKEIFADSVEIFDFGHYYPYKELWADCFKDRLNIEVYPRRILSYYVNILTKIDDSLRAKLRQNARLMKFAKYVRWRFKLLTGAYERR